MQGGATAGTEEEVVDFYRLNDLLQAHARENYSHWLKLFKKYVTERLSEIVRRATNEAFHEILPQAVSEAVRCAVEEVRKPLIMQALENDEILNADDAARLLKLHRRTIYALCRSGKLPHK